MGAQNTSLGAKKLCPDFFPYQKMRGPHMISPIFDQKFFFFQIQAPLVRGPGGLYATQTMGPPQQGILVSTTRDRRYGRV